MKRFTLLSVAVMMALSMMAIGNNSGSTKANAIDFDWETGNVHEGGTKWYRVDLAPLYEEVDPTLSLYLTNPSRDYSVDVNMKATVAGEVEERSYTIAPHQHKSWAANASLLVRMKQKEVFLTLNSNGKILLSAKVFDSADLDETCKDARTLNWATAATQTAGYAAWWKIDLSPVKTAANKDAKITITNKGAKQLTLIAGQSLDCPSSGTTTRTFTLAAGQTMYDTVPRSMITSVMSDELYVSFENNQPIEFKVELIDQPAQPAIDNCANAIDAKATDAFVITAGTHLYRFKVAEMNAEKKYEPEFTYRNEGAAPLQLTTKMAFECPAYGATTTNYTIAPSDEEIVVYKKNMLEGLVGVEYIYLQVTANQDVKFYGRMKHVREGKACKTNIDFDWVAGHRQAARTTQWYAIDVKEAKQNVKDIIVNIENEGAATATMTASVAFSCPYIDLQEVTRSIAAGSSVSRKISYSTYAMMSDTIWVGLETNQPVRLWAQTEDAQKQTADEKCLNAIDFNWQDGARQNANDTVWYKIGLNEVRTLKQFPTVYVQNLGNAKATIYGELSLECPDVIANEKREMTIAAQSAYSKTLSRNMFENITQDTVYLCVVATQDIAFEIRLTEEAEGTSCNSAIRFNWVSGNDQAANANLWYAIDLREAMQTNKDIEVKIANKDNAACAGSAWLAYTCPFESQQEVKFNLGAKESKSKVLPHSMLETLNDSVLYIRLIGNTALHVEAKMVDPAPFTAIDCPTTMVPLEWNTLYTQTDETVWYILTGDVLTSLDTLTTTPEVYVHNLAGANNTIKAEVAYRCPITAEMITKGITLSNGQELTKMIERATIEQVIKKDTVLVRVTASGKFEFKADLVSPYTGNDRMHAVRVAFSEAYEQAANSIMWYKINTKDLKADQTLHGKSLYVSTKNKGGDADLKVEVYEDVSTVDLLEGRGKRTIAAGKSASHNVPAYAIYGVADKEVYVKVTTNQPLTISSSLSNYAPAAVDSTQAKAKLLVPNVNYTVAPGTSWFAVCLPYIRNNYMLTDATNVEFTNPSASNATVAITATWQDQLTFATPERSRTIAAGKTVMKTYKELIDAAIRRAGYNYSVEGTDSQFLDSLIREAVTSDSLTAYFRVTTDQPLNIRVNTLQNTGDACANSMAFDWEHGNVNPAGQTTWYQVALDSTKVPVGKDLRLHVENWANVDALASAGLYFDCDSSALKSIDYTIGASEDAWKDIDRDLLSNLGWADLLINYTSDNTTRIWVEVIDEKPREKVVDSIPLFLCDGAEYLDSLTMIPHPINAAIDSTLHWKDSIEFLNDTAMAMWDSIVYYDVVVLRDPTLYEIKDFVEKPVIKRGQQIDVKKATDWLIAQLDSVRTDTIKMVETIIWEWSKDGVNFKDIAIPTPAEAVVLRYRAVTECEEDTLESNPFYNRAYGSYKDTTVCDSLRWEGKLYTASIKDSALISLPNNRCDSMAYLNLTVLTNPTIYPIANLSGTAVVKRGEPIDVSAWDADLKAKVAAEVAANKSIADVKTIGWEWSKNGVDFELLPTTATPTEAVSIRYFIETACKTLYSDQYNNTAIDSIKPIECGSYTWTANGEIYTKSTRDTVSTKSATNSSCDSIVIMDLTIKTDPTIYPIANLSGTPVIKRGQLIDVSAWDTDLKAKVATEVAANKSIADIKTIGWEWSKNGKDFELLPTTATPTEAVSIRYFIETACKTLYSDQYNNTAIDSIKPIECGSYTWTANGEIYTKSTRDTVSTKSATNSSCDSIVIMDLTIKTDPTYVKLNSLTGTPVVKRGQPIDVRAWTRQIEDKIKAEIAATTATTVTYKGLKWEWSKDGVNFEPLPATATPTEAVSIRYSIVTDCKAGLTEQGDEYYSTARDTLVVKECNYYTWAANDSLYTVSTKDSIIISPSATNSKCDSVSYLNLTIGNPLVQNLEAVSKYGNRLLMVNLKTINATTSWNLDAVTGAQYVKWYQVADPEDVQVGEGYYLTKEDGEPFVGEYYAIISIPSDNECGLLGYTNHLVCEAPAAAPMLMPSMARPEETITIYNLDPMKETIIRVYTTEGLMVSSYTVSGQDTFQITANAENGFYLVELNSEDMKSTLRYIVK